MQYGLLVFFHKSIIESIYRCVLYRLLAFLKVAIGDPMKGKVSKFPFVSNKEKIIENLITRFPKEKEGVEKFFKLLKVGPKVSKFPHQM